MPAHHLHRAIAPILALCAVSGTPGRAAADSVRRIGIVVTVRVNVDVEAGRRLAAELGEVLRKERPVDVIAGLEADRRLPPQGLPDDCVANSNCRLDLGRRLDAEELLLLVIVKLGEEIQIDATWANVASGQVTSRPALVVAAGADRTAVFTDAVARLLPHIAKAAPPAGPNIIVVPTPVTAGSDGRHFTTGTWIATGVAASALVGAGVFALSAQQKYAVLEDDGCRDHPCQKSDIDSLTRHALAADVLFGVAAASTVTALLLYLRSGPQAAGRASSPPPVAVSAGPERVGLMVGGRF